MISVIQHAQLRLGLAIQPQRCLQFNVSSPISTFPFYMYVTPINWEKYMVLTVGLKYFPRVASYTHHSHVLISVAFSQKIVSWEKTRIWGDESGYLITCRESFTRKVSKKPIWVLFSVSYKYICQLYCWMGETKNLKLLWESIYVNLGWWAAVYGRTESDTYWRGLSSKAIAFNCCMALVSI